MTIIIFMKYFLPWLVAVIAVIVGYVKLQGQVKNNSITIKKHDKLLTSGIAGGAPFITEPEHDKLQTNCQREIHKEIQTIKDDMSDIKDVMKEGDECRKEARNETSHQFSALRKEFSDFYTNMNLLIGPLVTKVAVNESEINHLKNKSGKK